MLIEIPSYLLPDFSRDFNWRAVAKLLDAIGAESVGEKRARNQQQRLDEALQVWRAAAAADAGGLKGQERIDFIVTESGINANGDARKIHKIIEVARQHLGLPLRTGGLT